MDYNSNIFTNIERITCELDGHPALHERGLFFRSSRTNRAYYVTRNSIQVRERDFHGCDLVTLKFYRGQDEEMKDRKAELRAAIDNVPIREGWMTGLLVRCGRYGRPKYIPAILLPDIKDHAESGVKSLPLRIYRTIDLLELWEDIVAFTDYGQSELRAAV